MTSPDQSELVKYVDPDILAHAEGFDPATYDRTREREFKEFFETGWHDPKYDDLRKVWNPLITHEDPRCRVSGKTALWAVFQLREANEKTRASARRSSIEQQPTEGEK
jgi:hypothetical protein